MGQNSEEQTESYERRVSMGIPGLDQLLGGGVTGQRLYLVQGDPGSGKTTLALQFLLKGAAEGEKTLYITLSESRRDLVSIARSHGWDLGSIHIHEVKTRVERDGTDTEQYSVFHPAEVELDDIVRRIIDTAAEVHPTRAVIDSLSEVRLLARDALRYRRQLLALKDFFSEIGCTLIVLDASVERREDVQSNTLPHGVITLEHSTPDYGTRRRRLIVNKLRGVKFDDSYHDFCIETGGVVVYPRLPAPVVSEANDRSAVPSGVPELDQLTGGGPTRGTSVVIMGGAGTGKSTLACQYITAAAQRGEHSAVFTFDETRATFLDRAEGFGMPTKGFVERDLIEVHQVEPGALSPGEFVHSVRDSVEERGSRIVVIDSLNGYLQATPGERFLLIQLHELLTYLASRGVITFVTVAQHGLPGEPLESHVDVSYLADSVILLRYFELRGSVRKSIAVLKKRIGLHEYTIRELILAQGGVRVGQPLSGFHGILTGIPTYEGDELGPSRGGR